MDLQNWNADDFQYVVEAGKAYNFTVAEGKVVLGAEAEGVNPKDLQVNDKTALQNYGRPYAADGKGNACTYIGSPLEQKMGPGGYGQWPGVEEGWFQVPSLDE